MCCCLSGKFHVDLFEDVVIFCPFICLIHNVQRNIFNFQKSEFQIDQYM